VSRLVFEGVDREALVVQMARQPRKGGRGGVEHDDEFVDHGRVGRDQALAEDALQ
jgi:hypothetical protein